MANEFDPAVSVARMGELGRRVGGAGTTVVAGAMVSFSEGRFAAKQDLSMCALALAPPALHIQPVAEGSIEPLGQPRAIVAREIAKVKVSPLQVKRNETIAMQAKVKLRSGQRYEIGVVSGGLYGDEHPEVAMQVSLACSQIIDWLQNPS